MDLACTCPCSPSVWLTCSVGQNGEACYFLIIHLSAEHTAVSSKYEIVYFSFCVSTENLCSTFHWGVIIKVLLDFLQSRGSTVTGRLRRQCYRRQTSQEEKWEFCQLWRINFNICSYFVLSPLPSSSSSTHQTWGCPRGLWYLQGGPCPWQENSCPVRQSESLDTSSDRDRDHWHAVWVLTCLWEVLASRGFVLWTAGELRGGSVRVLVPAVWALKGFSRNGGGLPWEQQHTLMSR